MPNNLLVVKCPYCQSDIATLLLMCFNLTVKCPNCGDSFAAHCDGKKPKINMDVVHYIYG